MIMTKKVIDIKLEDSNKSVLHPVTSIDNIDRIRVNNGHLEFKNDSGEWITLENDDE